MGKFHQHCWKCLQQSSYLLSMAASHYNEFPGNQYKHSDAKCVCFTTMRRCILSSGDETCPESQCPPSPIIKLTTYLNSSEWFSFADAHSAPLYTYFVTSLGAPFQSHGDRVTISYGTCNKLHFSYTFWLLPLHPAL